MVTRWSMAGADPLGAVEAVLRCPVCAGSLTVGERSAGCERGHSFDRARQGYLSLLAHPLGIHGDGAEMIAARGRLLDSGRYEPVLDAVARAAADVLRRAPVGIAVEFGCGTGHYLARVLEAAGEGARGIGVDVSKPALRAASRAHPRGAALLADAWSVLPLADGSAGVTMSIFAPRNPGEYLRLLAPGGAAVVAVPGREHLGELVGALGLVRVDDRKEDRLATTMQDFAERDSQRVGWAMRLTRAEIERIVAMGPSAHHLDPAERRRRVDPLPDPFEVTADVTVRTFTPR